MVLDFDIPTGPVVRVYSYGVVVAWWFTWESTQLLQWTGKGGEEQSIIQQVAEGLCPIGVLADYVEDRLSDQPDAMALLPYLRQCEGVGSPTMEGNR